MKYFPIIALLLLIAGLSKAQNLSHASLVYDIYSQYPNASSDPAQFTLFNNRLYFSADNYTAGREQWQYTGSGIPTLVADLNSAGNSGAAVWSWTAGNAVAGNKMYFNGNNGTSGWELFSCDTANNIILEADINPGAGNANPVYFTSYNNIIYFFAATPSYGYELWQYNPATATAARLTDLNPGPDSSVAGSGTGIIPFKGRLYFAANDGLHGEELFAYDPATGNTALIADINPGIKKTTPASFLTSADKLYFSAAFAAYGRELYSYNGTDTPVRLTDLVADTADGVYPADMAWYRNRIVFSGRNAGTGWELFAYDTASAHAAMISDLYPGASSGGPAQFTLVDTMLCFTAAHAAAGQELWQYDGVHPPQLAADIAGGPNGSNPTGLTVFNSRLYMNARNLNSGYELFVLDSFARYSSNSIGGVAAMHPPVVYPNPVRDQLTINSDIAGICTITDITGRTLCQQALQPGRTMIDMSRFKTGLYLYHILEDGRIIAQGKLLKE